MIVYNENARFFFQYFIENDVGGYYLIISFALPGEICWSLASIIYKLYLTKLFKMKESRKKCSKTTIKYAIPRPTVQVIHFNTPLR